MKIYPASFIHRLASSLQTARKQSKISKVTCIQTVHIYICIRGRDVSRKEGKDEKRRGRYIYIYTREAGSKLSPRRDYGRCLWALALNYNQEDGWSPCPPRPSGPFVSLQASSFPKARDTYAFRISSSPRLKIKDRGAYSTLCRGRRFSEHIADLERQEETRMLSVVYLLGFFNPFLRTATLIALIARGM